MDLEVINLALTVWTEVTNVRHKCWNVFHAKVTNLLPLHLSRRKGWGCTCHRMAHLESTPLRLLRDTPERHLSQ